MARPRTTNKHLPKYVTVIHGAYWYRPPEGKAVRIADEGDLAALYTFMAGVAEPAKPLPPTCTLADCFRRYDSEVIPTLGARTQKDYRRHLKVLHKFCGHMAPGDLRPRDIGKFLDVPKGKIQRNRQVAVLSAVFAKIVGRWYVDGCTTNPCRDVERNEAKKRTRYVTDAEYKAVHAVMPARAQIAMDLALLTGQRQGDLLQLHWKNATEDGVFFQQGKTGKRLLVTISPTLEEVLTRAKRMVPQLPREYVLRKRNGQPYTSEGFRAIWQRGMRKAIKLGVIVERFTFHDLRAKSVSDSVTLEQAFERAGHTSMQMTRGTYDRGIRKVTPLR